jgi:hypothetical protein
MCCAQESAGHADRGSEARIDPAAEAIARAQRLIGSRPSEGSARLAWHQEALQVGDVAEIGALLISRDAQLAAH